MGSRGRRPGGKVNTDADLHDEKARERDGSDRDGPGDGPRRNAGQFAPGTNSHSGAVFRRGKDQIPRTSMRLMAAVVQLDGREDIYEGLRHVTSAAMARRNPRAFMAAVEFLADRLEGKPTQHIVADHRRSTTFVMDGQAGPVSADEAEAAVPERTRAEVEPRADLATLPPGLPTQALSVLPPPQ